MTNTSRATEDLLQLRPVRALESPAFMSSGMSPPPPASMWATFFSNSRMLLVIGIHASDEVVAAVLVLHQADAHVHVALVQGCGHLAQRRLHRGDFLGHATGRVEHEGDVDGLLLRHAARFANAQSDDAVVAGQVVRGARGVLAAAGGGKQLLSAEAFGTREQDGAAGCGGDQLGRVLRGVAHAHSAVGHALAVFVAHHHEAAHGHVEAASAGVCSFFA